jgi:hypothetical protein
MVDGSQILFDKHLHSIPHTNRRLGRGLKQALLGLFSEFALNLAISTTAPSQIKYSMPEALHKIMRYLQRRFW